MNAVITFDYIAYPLASLPLLGIVIVLAELKELCGIHLETLFKLPAPCHGEPNG